MVLWKAHYACKLNMGPVGRKIDGGNRKKTNNPQTNYFHTKKLFRSPEKWLPLGMFFQTQHAKVIRFYVVIIGHCGQQPSAKRGTFCSLNILVVICIAFEFLKVTRLLYLVWIPTSNSSMCNETIQQCCLLRKTDSRRITVSLRPMIFHHLQ